MIWTLTFVMFLASGEAKPGGAVFTTGPKCESIRQQLIDAADTKQLPDDAQSLVIGECRMWANPKSWMHP